MTNKELRNEMRHCRAVYRGTVGNDLDAYKKNLVRINRTVEYGKESKWLLKYNASLYEARTGKRI